MIVHHRQRLGIANSICYTDAGSGREAVCSLLCPAAAEDVSADAGEQGAVSGPTAEEDGESGGESAELQPSRGPAGDPGKQGTVFH